METKQKRKCCLEACETAMCGQVLRHSLLRTQKGYWVEARFSGDRARAFAGNDLLSAATVYTAVVRGAVTPCTLGDVVHDLTEPD